MKKLLALILALLMAFGMIACDSSSAGGSDDDGGELDAQAMAEDFADGMFTPDMEAIFDMTPYDLMIDSLESEEQEAAEAELDTQIEMGQQMLEQMYSELDLDWDVEVLEEEDLDEDKVDELNDLYGEADLEVTAAVAAQVEISLTVEEEEETQEIELVFVEIDGDWYLDINSVAALSNL